MDEPPRMSPFSRDTTLEAERVHHQVMERLGPEGRMRLTFQLCERLRATLAAGVRDRHPDYDEEQVRLAVIRLRIGDELFAEAFPGVNVRP